MFEKILLAVDGSENSVRAAEYTLDLVEIHPQIKVTVLAIANDKLSELEAKKVVEATEIMFKRKGYEVKKVVNKGGDPAQVISYYANNGPYDQVIMGSRGLSNITGLVLGSVSHKVLHMSKQPVTIVK